MIHLFKGSLFHKRLKPKGHQFRYSVFFLGLDLDCLEADIKSFWFFSYNKFNLFSIYDKDYLKDTSVNLRKKVDLLFEQHGYDVEFDKVVLITSARCLGMQFNPVSFYYCYKNDQVVYVVAEINNTFKERHTYILDNTDNLSSSIMTFSQDKQFYVSPFFNVEGYYKFKLTQYQTLFSIVINYFKDNSLLLHANLEGKRKKLTDLFILFIILSFPVVGITTFLYILFEAFRLRFFKQISLKEKHKKMHKHTYKSSSPTFLQNLCKGFFLKKLESIKNYCINIQFPSGLVKQIGDPAASKKLNLRVKDYAFYTRVCFRQEMGLGEAFVLGYWESDNVKELLAAFLEHKESVDSGVIFIGKFVNVILKFQHFLNRNSIFKSKKNIHKHYDLGNKFFECFLDSSMLYSCALYPSETATLAEAQEHKMNQIIKKADIKKGMTVLEIGSGWGSMAIEMVKQTGCNVTTVTLSREQFNYVQNRIKELGLTKNITVLYQDYRKIKGQFDRVISIEMVEAVGHKYLPVYFKKINDLLTQTGKAVIQAITIRDDVYDNYRKKSDWIRKYIFPGGHLLSVAHIKTLLQDTCLNLSQADTIGLHYVKTLEDWKIMFFEKITEIKKQGFSDEFIRKWHYYFEYSQAGFMQEYIQDFHLVLTKK